MNVTFADRTRIGLNIAFALAQPSISGGVFFRGFKTAPVPNPTALPTPIQPATYAFSIWFVILLGCLAYAIYQTLPRNRDNSLFHAIGWATAATMGLCCTWPLVARFGPVFMTVPIIFLMLATLLRALQLLMASHPRGALRWAVTAPLGLYAGWLAVAAFANTQEILTGYNIDVVANAPVPWAIGMIAGAAVVAAVGSIITHANPFFLSAIAWALAAIIAGNANDPTT